MILESINSMPAKVVHVFDMRYNSFSVGRSIENDMKIADISVSRIHSFLHVRKNQVLVEDNGSKFGTLVKIQRPHQVLRSSIDGTSLSTLMQVGRTLLYIDLQTTKEHRWHFPSLNSQNKVDTNSPCSYLRLRKDNLKVPAEFFEDNVIDLPLFEENKRKIG